MNEHTRHLIGFGVVVSIYGALVFADPAKLRAAFADTDATATTPGSIQHVEAERVTDVWSLGRRRRSDQYSCTVVTAFAVHGEHYSTHEPRLYDRARQQRSSAQASRYCARRYPVGSDALVTYLRADPTVASIDGRDFSRTLPPILRLGVLAVGLSALSFGVFAWRRETREPSSSA